MKKFIITAGMVFALSACSSSVAFKEQWDNYESERLSTSGLKDNQALAVFYRTENFKAPALNVYVNGDYQASLLDKSFTPVTLCANNQLISTSYSSTQKFGNRTQGTRHNLAAKEIHYFRAAKDASGSPVFEAVSADIAKTELKQLKGKVSNTLPRTKKCH